MQKLRPETSDGFSDFEPSIPEAQEYFSRDYLQYSEHSQLDAEKSLTDQHFHGLILKIQFCICSTKSSKLNYVREG